MITVQQQDAATLTIVSQMTGSKELDLNLYLFIPGELDISPEVISESEFSTVQSTSSVPITATRSFYLWFTAALLNVAISRRPNIG